jgi:hypothetical protein
MHFKSLLHVRDHSKATGPAHHMLEYIAQHINAYTGEAFELTVDRIAYRLQVSSQWVGQLRRQLVESGELIIRQSRGRRPNVYVIPTERCPACNPHAACEGDDLNPKVELGVDDPSPQVTPKQPQSNPKVEDGASPQFARIAPQKDVKEQRENDVHVNVEIDQANPKVGGTLTLGEEDLVDELVRRFRDEKSRPTYRRIVSRLGDRIVYPLMLAVWEVRHQIAVSPGAYFVGAAKQVAQRQGIDLGFQQHPAPG